VIDGSFSSAKDSKNGMFLFKGKFYFSLELIEMKVDH